ncbi:zf-TFIIB domain-containing protein [bacterium]|nr:zf-TFIIB domain-containing protein [bacterium]
MKCPACGNELTPLKIGQITVDVCKNGCGGVWFDKAELLQFDEPDEKAGEILVSIQRNTDVAVNTDAKHKCPRCGNIVMMRHYFTIKREVAIDECPKCGGIWLDAGELDAIRKEYISEKSRDEDAQKFIESNFGKKLDEMTRESKEKAQRAKKFAKIFRFLCPSYYIKGKQNWGAF